MDGAGVKGEFLHHSTPGPLDTPNRNTNSAQNPISRYGGGQAFSTPDNTKTQARPYRSPPTPGSTNPTHITQISAGPASGLPIIASISDWAHLLYTTTDYELTRIVNELVTDPEPPCPTISLIALITPELVQHFTHGSYQGTMGIHECFSGILNLLQTDPSISLL